MMCPACSFPLDYRSMSSMRGCWCTGLSEPSWACFEHQRPFLATPHPTAFSYLPLAALSESEVTAPSLPTQSILSVTTTPVDDSTERSNGSGGANISPHAQILSCGDLTSSSPRVSLFEQDSAIEESMKRASDMDECGKSHVARGHRGVSKSRVMRTGLYRCEWRACKYRGEFSREAELMRHIRSKHVCPGLYECPEKDCRRPFNRKDNMMEHLRRMH